MSLFDTGLIVAFLARSIRTQHGIEHHSSPTIHLKRCPRPACLAPTTVLHLTAPKYQRYIAPPPPRPHSQAAELVICTIYWKISFVPLFPRVTRGRADTSCVEQKHVVVIMALRVQSHGSEIEEQGQPARGKLAAARWVAFFAAVDSSSYCAGTFTFLISIRYGVERTADL